MKPPEECASIGDVRLGIDTLDREVIALIGRRARYVEAAARFKTGESSVRAPERRKALLEARRRWAEEEGLSPSVIEAVYETLSPTSWTARWPAGAIRRLNENSSR